MPTDNANLSGVINYAAEADASTSKFDIYSPRIRLIANDKAIKTSGSATLSIPFTDSGRDYVANGAANQVFTAADPKFCTEFGFTKNSSSAFTFDVAMPSGKNFLCGAAASRTNARATNPGCSLRLKAIDATTYIVVSEVGTWTYT